MSPDIIPAIVCDDAHMDLGHAHKVGYLRRAQDGETPTHYVHVPATDTDIPDLTGRAVSTAGYAFTVAPVYDCPADAEQQAALYVGDEDNAVVSVSHTLHGAPYGKDGEAADLKPGDYSVLYLVRYGAALLRPGQRLVIDCDPNDDPAKIVLTADPQGVVYRVNP